MTARHRFGATATAVGVTAALLLLILPIHGRAARPAAEALASSPSASPPTEAGTDYRDPDVVCQRFAAAVHRRDAAADPSAQAAYRRAAAYLTGELAAVVAAQPDGADVLWTEWQAHRAATDPEVTAVVDADEQPTDGHAVAYRAARVTVIPIGADGWRGPVQMHLVYCTLHREITGGWRVAHYDLAEDEAETP